MIINITLIIFKGNEVVSSSPSFFANNGLSPGWRQAIVWTNARILLIRPLGTNFSEILIEIHTFTFKKIHLKMPSGKWQPFCLDLNVVNALWVLSPEQAGMLWGGVSALLSNSEFFMDLFQIHWEHLPQYLRQVWLRRLNLIQYAHYGSLNDFTYLDILSSIFAKSLCNFQYSLS